MAQSIFVHIFDWMNWRVRLIVCVTHFWWLKLVFVQKLSNVLAVLIVRPEAIN
jgi:hypothetical protein